MTINASRVLFLLDYGSQEAEALRTVAALSGGQPLEVQGLFVEDEDLIGAAQLPCVAEVSVHTHEVTQLNPETTSVALSQHAIFVRNVFETSARRHRLTHTFEISRGRTIEKCLEAASGRDIVVVNRPLLGAGLRARGGAQFASFAAAQADILFVNEPWQSGSSVVVMCPPGEEQSRVVEKARSIATAEGLNLVLATVQGPDPENGPDADEVVQLASFSEEALVDLCQVKDARLIVIPGGDGVNLQRLLTALLDRLSCSLLCVAPADQTESK